jgi:hypothetical protein
MTVGAEFFRLATRVLEHGPGIGRDELARLDLLEAVSFENLAVLCLQQSARNSAGPQVDVPPALLRDGVLDRHVGDLDAAAGAENAVDLG